GFRSDDSVDVRPQVTPSGSISYLIRQTGTKPQGGFAEGFRAPTFNDLFFPPLPGHTVGFGNPNLKPELSSEWNVGFEQNLWGQRFSLETVYFRRRVKDLIAVVF